MAAGNAPSNGKYLRGLAPPVLVLTALVAGLAYALYAQAHIREASDQENLREWISQSRIFRETLPKIVRDYVNLAESDGGDALNLKAEEIHEHLQALGEPLKIYERQLPLFPTIYRLEVQFDEDWPPIAWDSAWPRDRAQTQTLLHPLCNGAVLRMEYHLHAYTKQQEDEARQRWLFIGLSVLVCAGFAAAAAWIYFFLRRERQREWREMHAREQIERAEKLALENKLARQEVERRHEEMGRKYLEQQSLMYANVGITAGSYAHNIKNLLVRPHDLLRRCLDAAGVPAEQAQMLREVRQSLHTVTERLQQILRTVRRDPSHSEAGRVDLNDIVKEVYAAWNEMAKEKWKLTLSLELSAESLPIVGDRSHILQAFENLLFNARDATFEMRNHIREQARHEPGEEAKRHAVLAAAGWRGAIRFRTRRDGNAAVFEIEDNGVGMTEEVRRRCVETHFSTKRDNALFEGNTTGMGLGLSFVQTILENHQAKMEILSEPLRGTTFRIVFPCG